MFKKKRPYYEPGPLRTPREHIAAQNVLDARLVPVRPSASLEVPRFTLSRSNPDISPVTLSGSKETYHFPPTFVLEMGNGRVLDRDGLVITSDNALLADTAIHFGRPTHRHRIFEHDTLSSPTHIQGRVAVLASTDATVYFH